MREIAEGCVRGPMVRGSMGPPACPGLYSRLVIGSTFLYGTAPMNTKLKGKRLDPSQLARAIVEQAGKINPQPPEKKAPAKIK